MILDDDQIGRFGRMRQMRGDDAPPPRQDPPAPKAKPPPPSASPSNVLLAVQRALASRGWFNGTAHGLADAHTVEGVKRAQREFGLPVTGAVSPLLLSSLGIKVAGLAAQEGETQKVAPVVKRVWGFVGLGAIAAGLMWFLSRRREEAAMAESYDDVADPDDFEEPDDEDLIEGEESSTIVDAEFTKAATDGASQDDEGDDR